MIPSTSRASLRHGHQSESIEPYEKFPDHTGSKGPMYCLLLALNRTRRYRPKVFSCSAVRKPIGGSLIKQVDLKRTTVSKKCLHGSERSFWQCTENATDCTNLCTPLENGRSTSRTAIFSTPVRSLLKSTRPPTNAEKKRETRPKRQILQIAYKCLLESSTTWYKIWILRYEDGRCN